MADRQTAPRGLPLRIALPFSVPTIPLSALGLAVAVYLPNYFASHLAVSMVTIGLVWMSVRLLDLPVDVILAGFMDHTRTAIGRYRVWLIVGAPITMIALYKLFMAPVGFSGSYLFWWLAALALGTSILSLAHQAWSATLAPQYDERSRLFGLINAVGVLGTLAAMVVLIGAPALHLSDAASVQACGWFIIAVAPIGVLLALLRTPERITADGEAERAERHDPGDEDRQERNRLQHVDAHAAERDAECEQGERDRQSENGRREQLCQDERTPRHRARAFQQQPALTAFDRDADSESKQRDADRAKGAVRRQQIG